MFPTLQQRIRFKSKAKAAAAAAAEKKREPQKFAKINSFANMTSMTAGSSDGASSSSTLQQQQQQNGPDLAALGDAIDQVLGQQEEQRQEHLRTSRRRQTKANSRGRHRKQFDADAVANSEIPPLVHDQLRSWMANADAHLPQTIQELVQSYRRHFPRWMVYLCAEFNLLLYGFGSKRELLDEFCKDQLVANNYSHMVICGYQPNCSVKQIISSLVENLRLGDLVNTFVTTTADTNDVAGAASIEAPSSQVAQRKSKSLWRGGGGGAAAAFGGGGGARAVEMAEAVRAALVEKADSLPDVVLVVHNIDGPALRDETSQAALSVIAAAPNIRLVASIDHVNATLMWDQTKLSRFRWVWLDTTTYRSYEKELMASDSRMLGLDESGRAGGGSGAGSHSLSSLESVWSSLTSNSRRVFVTIARCSLKSKEGLSFWQLYRTCRDQFLVSSETALQQQLAEFRDHHLISSRRRADGQELVVLTVDARIALDFMKQKGLIKHGADDADTDNDEEDDSTEDEAPRRRI